MHNPDVCTEIFPDTTLIEVGVCIPQISGADGGIKYSHLTTQ